MTVDVSFWKNKRVFVTGHTGFKGSWLSLWLNHMGAIVRGYSLEPITNPSLFDVAKVADCVDSVVGDICDSDKLASSMAEFQPDIVLHLAAQALVKYSYDNPLETYQTNVMGSLHVLECIRKTPSVKAAVMVTTDKCYENREWDWGYRENEAMGGYDPYSSSKGCMELLVSSYRRSYFSDGSVKVASARAGNVIGGGDWSLDRLIPDLIHAACNNQPAQIRSPHSIRPWQHVLEPLSGYLLLAQRLFESDEQRYQSGWNFGPNESDAQPVCWIADKICQVWQQGCHWQDCSSDDQPHEAQHLKLDCSKAKNQLGWIPQLCLSDAIEFVVDWHKSHLDNQDMNQLTIKQIQKFIDIRNSNER